MKQKYTLTVANAEINVITDESRETIDTIVGVVDRRIREIHLNSKNCSRTEAALLLCLDYCAEKLKLQKKIKMADAEITRLVALNDSAARENAALTREIEALRETLNMKSMTTPAPTRVSRPVQMTINESLKDEEKYTPFVEEEIPAEDPVQTEILPRNEVLSPKEEPAMFEQIEEAPAPAVVEEAPLTIIEETPAKEETAPAPVVEEEKPKKKRVRSMFDLITFDKL